MTSILARGFATALLLFSMRASAIEVEGVPVPDRARLTTNGPELVLNGVGVRTRLMFKIYVAALYLPNRSENGETILGDDQPVRLFLHMLRNLTPHQLSSSINDALQETLTPEQRTPLEARLRRFHAIFETGQKVKEGTQIVIDYVPQHGTIILVDGEEKDRIPGGDFNRALLRIWIGERPRDPKLRKALLGIGSKYN